MISEFPMELSFSLPNLLGNITCIGFLFFPILLSHVATSSSWSPFPNKLFELKYVPQVLLLLELKVVVMVKSVDPISVHSQELMWLSSGSKAAYLHYHLTPVPMAVVPPLCSSHL